MNKNVDEKPVGRSRRRLLLIYIALGHRLCIHTYLIPTYNTVLSVIKASGLFFFNLNCNSTSEFLL